MGAPLPLRAAGALLIAALLVVLPGDVYRAVQAILFLVAAATLFAVALALFAGPVRNALAAAFSLPLPRAGTWFSMPQGEEMRIVLTPLVDAGLLGVVLLVSALLRQATSG